jgi:hypothetical protein
MPQVAACFSQPISLPEKINREEAAGGIDAGERGDQWAVSYRKALVRPGVAACARCLVFDSIASDEAIAVMVEQCTGVNNLTGERIHDVRPETTISKSE